MTTDTTCQRCGAAVKSDAEFCPLCGLAVSGAVPLAVTGPPVVGVAAGRAALDAQALAELREATLGEYEILSELGRGGMATVYLAHEIALNRKVAIKLISPHLLADNTAERFLREARTAAGLSHPNLIPIHSVRETDSLLFFVMKYVAGPSLEVLLKQGQRLSIPVVQAILSETAAALGYAHRRQIVHRDVKPGNIMIDDEGRVVVTDFGIARDTQSTGLTGTGMAVGTPMYMSPEQCIGDPVSGASDQYSLGVVGYEMLTGKVPFEAPNAIAMMYAHIHTTPPPVSEVRPDCPPQLSAALMRMLQKSATERWPSIEEANRAIGAPPLTGDDPVRQTLMELARVGAAARRLSIPSTPRSPVPHTRSIPRRPLRTPLTPSRGVVANSAPTVRITPIESEVEAEPEAATAPESTSRLPLIPIVASGVVALAVLAWLGLSWRSASESRTATSNAPPLAASSAAPPAAPVVPAAPPGGAGTAVADNAAAEASKLPPPGAIAPAAGRAAPTRAAAVAISPPVSQLRVGEKVQLRALVRDAAGRLIADRPVRWATSDPRVASITSGGALLGVGEGRAVVTTTVDGKLASLSVIVVPPPTVAPTAVAVAAMEITPSTISVAAGATGQLRATPRDAAGNALTDRAIQWTSANPQVADVSTNGLVIGVAPGTTQINAAAEGHATSVPVTVPALVAAAPPPAPPDPTPAIRKLLDSFVAAIHARNVARMISLYPTLSQTSRATWDKLFEDYPDVAAAIVPESVEIAPADETAAFDLSLTLVNGRERQRILMHFQTNLEQDNGAWRFKQIVQSYVKQ